MWPSVGIVLLRRGVLADMVLESAVVVVVLVDAANEMWEGSDREAGGRKEKRISAERNGQISQDKRSVFYCAMPVHCGCLHSCEDMPSTKMTQRVTLF